jgi:hypothetical protein
VVGHLAAAVGLGHLDLERRPHRRVGEHVALRGVAPLGVDVRVLEQQQSLLAGPRLDPALGGPLQLPRLGVGHPAQPSPAHGSAAVVHQDDSTVVPVSNRRRRDRRPPEPLRLDRSGDDPPAAGGSARPRRYFPAAVAICAGAVTEAP